MVFRWIGLVLALVSQEQKRECSPVDIPKKLRSLDLMVDSAKLAALRPAADFGSGDVLITVLLSADAAAWDSEHPDGNSASLPMARAVLDALRKPPKGFPPAFRVRFTRDSLRGPVLEAASLCPPTIQGNNLTDVRVGVVRVEGAAGMVMPARPQNITPSYRIGPNGEVIEVDLGAGTRIPDVDRALREHMLAERFKPALLDGKPVEVWLRGKKIEIVP